MATTPAAGKISELDKELVYLLKSNAAVNIGVGRVAWNDYGLLIPAIKKAFKDNGWLPIEAPVKKYLEAGGSTDYIVMSRADAERNGL